MSYPVVPLGRICKEIYRYPSFYGMEHLPSGVPVIRGEHINSWGQISQNWPKFWFISEEISQKFPRTILQEDDLVFTVRGTIGKVGMITKAHDGAQLSPNLIRISPNREKIDATYLWYFLRSIKDTTSADIQNQVTIASVRSSDLQQLKIPFPPLPEQKRIAAQLAQANRLRQLRRHASQLGESYLQSAFLAMFGDPIQNSRKWKLKPLQEIIDPQRPITYGILMPGKDIPDGIPYIRVVDIADHKIKINQVRRTTKEIATQYKRSTLQTNDLLMSIRGHVGRLAKVPKGLDGANITQDTARFYPKPEVCNVDYLFGCLLTNEMQAWMAERVRGVAVQGINLGDLKIMPIPLPPLPEQERFAKIVARYEKLRAQMHESTRQAELLFQGLLWESFG